MNTPDVIQARQLANLAYLKPGLALMLLRDRIYSGRKDLMRHSARTYTAGHLSTRRPGTSSVPWKM